MKLSKVNDKKPGGEKLKTKEPKPLGYQISQHKFYIPGENGMTFQQFKNLNNLKLKTARQEHS